MASGSPAHQELCFGCGLSNPFGLQLDVQRDGAGAVVGRFFVKQDHQGPGRTAHPGVLVAALLEAVALAGGRPEEARVELDLAGSAPVGTFVRVEASADGAIAHDETTGEEVARARCPRA